MSIQKVWHVFPTPTPATECPHDAECQSDEGPLSSAEAPALRL